MRAKEIQHCNALDAIFTSKKPHKNAVFRLSEKPVSFRVFIDIGTGSANFSVLISRIFNFSS